MPRTPGSSPHLNGCEDGHALDLPEVVVCAVGVCMEHIFHCWHHERLGLLTQPATCTCHKVRTVDKVLGGWVEQGAET